MLQKVLYVQNESQNQKFLSTGIRNHHTTELFTTFPTLSHHLVIINFHNGIDLMLIKR